MATTKGKVSQETKNGADRNPDEVLHEYPAIGKYRHGLYMTRYYSEVFTSEPERD